MSPGHIDGAAAESNQLPAASIKFKRHTNKYTKHASWREREKREGKTESKEEGNSQW